MCNHLNLKVLIDIFTIIYLMIIIIMRGENFVAHLDGLGGTPVCRGTLVAHHCLSKMAVFWATLRDEHRLRVFENRVLKRIFGPKRDEVTGGWRQLQNEEFHNLDSVSEILGRSNEGG
jgi:hypothetical protein